MAIPAFHECMLPILEFVSDKNEHSNQELINHLSNYFQLSEKERNTRLPSGSQYLMYNRVLWAKTYLKKAMLIEESSRSFFEITSRGEEVLKENLSNITVKYLKKFEEFRNFQNITKKDKVLGVEDSQKNTQNLTPEEAIDYGYEKLNANISGDLLEQIKNNTPRFFENLVIQLLVKMGYGGSLKEAAQVVGNSGDGGIDGLIKEDRLGLDIVYVQAKRWEGTVGRPEIQGFIGALAGKRSKRGIFITTSGFTKGAIEYSKSVEHNIVLIDGEKLTELMVEYNLGVSVQKIIEIKQIDFDFFST